MCEVTINVNCYRCSMPNVTTWSFYHRSWNAMRITETFSGTRAWWSPTPDVLWGKLAKITFLELATSMNQPTTWRVIWVTPFSKYARLKFSFFLYMGFKHYFRARAGSDRFRQDRSQHLFWKTPPPKLDDVRNQRRRDCLQPFSNSQRIEVIHKRTTS